MLNIKGHVGLVCTFTYSSFCEQMLPLIIIHTSLLIVHVSVSVLLGLGSDV